MPHDVAFDLYDERWRECWLAATSTTRLRKKQVDVDIQERVHRLIQEHGPNTDKPLTLRVYGTMIKGFCVLNNERARALYCDSERVVLMFARQPFTEDKIRLPAAKRQRMEAALTLDLDLAKVEACETFNWTQAPLEEGALLQLGGAAAQDVLPCIELAEAMPQLLDPNASDMALPQKAEMDWLPRFELGPLEAQVEGQVPNLEKPVDPLMQLMGAPHPMEFGEVHGVHGVHGHGEAGHAGNPGNEAARPLKRCRTERATAALLRPGLVYGFDSDPMMSSQRVAEWQLKDDESLCRPRLGAVDQVEVMENSLDCFLEADHFGFWLRQVADPDMALYHESGPGKDQGEFPQVQSLLGGVCDFPPSDARTQAKPDVQAVNAEYVPDTLGSYAAQHADMDFAMCDDYIHNADRTNVEVQDDRTAEVGQIILDCLRRDGHSIEFEKLVPPGEAERTTAAMTFTALLALASAGDLHVLQQDPFGTIVVAECCN
ncbi:usp33 [Symbiodinium natans]|uniref:Usp33 protein n=1 Tax=Symbiodinium natans TaxID=878477 RepID=A0A812PI76_9DINO|nr:usp33 [Symbiodinium natans]